MTFTKWLAGALAALALHTHAGAQELVVAAASSLTNAMTEIGQAFEKLHPGVKVLNSFSASGKLAAQIVEGAPVDVFASADAAAMERAQQQGMIDASTRQDFVRNEVVLIVPAGNPRNIASVADLSREGVTRVALGNPASVPVGRYARAALQREGRWEDVERVQILGQNVRQVLDYVARGEVDAGLVFATDAAVRRDKVRVVQTLESPVPVLYPIALVRREGRSPAAAGYLDFVQSEQGRSILSKHGFSRP